jgi:hypothetical protein
MRFTNENLLTGEVFQCRLQCNQCGAQTRSGRPCRNRVCVGTPTCHQHRANARVGPSLIPGAGKGLFAKRDYAVGDLIGVYTGEVVSYDVIDNRYGGGNNTNAPYAVHTNIRSNRYPAGRAIDSACRRGLMSLANSSNNRRDANARFAYHRGVMRVRAARPINRGDEILIYYGAAYRRTMGNSIHTTK